MGQERVAAFDLVAFARRQAAYYRQLAENSPNTALRELWLSAAVRWEQEMQSRQMARASKAAEVGEPT